MKHYLLSPEGLQRIADKDVEIWRLQGGFMKAEGPIMIPVALGMPDVECIEPLLRRAENFTYWFTPDFRVALTTKDGRSWKMRFEVRGADRDGKACVQTERIDGKIRGDGLIKALAEVFVSMGKHHGAPPPEGLGPSQNESETPAPSP